MTKEILLSLETSRNERHSYEYCVKKVDLANRREYTARIHSLRVISLILEYTLVINRLITIQKH